ncbi:MAG: hypothetical protein GXO80_13755 [Chlorobi bacterium]|nr:hypothetical protein [Chlorobiota bacterium]
MLNNKFLIFISVLAVAAVIIVSLQLEKKSRKLPPVINALPAEVSYFLETDDFNYFLNKISKNEALKEILEKNDITEKTFRNITFLDSLLHQNRKIKRFFNQKSVIISAHPTGMGKNEFLFIAGANSDDKNIISQTIKNIKSATNSGTSNFAGAGIIKQNFKNHKTIYYTFYKNYLLMSFSEIMIQKSIKNINSGVGLADNKAFKKLYQKTENQDDAQLFINYETLFSNTGSIFNNSFKNELKLLQNTAYWSAFNISLKRKRLKLTGHTILKPEMQFLSIFKNTQPQKNKVLNLLPEKTSFFLTLNIKSGNYFKYKYEDFLARVKQLNDFQINLAEFYKTYKIKEDETDLYSVTDNEIALIREDINKNGKNPREYIFINFNDKSKTEKFFNQVISKYCKKNNIETSSYYETYKTEEDNYTIAKLPVDNIPEIFYGIIFQNINAKYYTLIDDFIIFGKSASDLKEIINSFEKDKTFKRKSPNYEFIKSLPDESNISFYIDISHSAKNIENSLQKKLSEKFDKNLSSLKRVQGPAVQIIFDSYPAYTTVDIGLNSLTQEISETVWEVRLDTLIETKPFIVINHNTDEKEIVIQDVANKIYLIDKNGKILWTRQLDGKIISNIYQIDYYENKKLQLLFNTESKIYCIDRKGNWLEGYPVKLKSKATCGISLFDYDQNRNYRIFVACANKSVYLFDKNGEIISGWNFDKTKSYVTQSIKHFKNGDKDYIAFRDRNNLYLLNRKGEIRVKPEVNISISKNTEIWFTEDNINDKAHFSISNPAGIVYSIYENGKIKKNSFKTYARDHYYVYKDITGDQVPEYIFTDKNQTDVYDGISKKRLFSYAYDEDLKTNVTVYEFNENDIRLGASSENKIYLINNKGNLCKGFPLTGTGLFSITVFDNNPEFSLITGNKDNYLYKYNIK